MTYLYSHSSVLQQGRDLSISICKNSHRYNRVALSALNVVHVEKKLELRLLNQIYSGQQ